MARFLVTGGCGFIGSHLADSLVAEGHEVRILDDLSTGRRENAPAQAVLRIGDVAERTALTAVIEGVDGCFHLAAIASVQRSNEEWLHTHRVNLTRSIAVFDAARTASRNGRPIPVVYASSAAIYGDNQAVPLSEDTAPEPLTAYGADKLGTEQHARVGAVVHAVPSFGLRFFNIYGPRQDPSSPYSGVISIFADRIARRQVIEIHGDGAQTRDFVFVADCIAHLRAAMDCLAGSERVPARAEIVAPPARAEIAAPPTRAEIATPPARAEIVNVCTGRSTSVLALARILGDMAGVPARIAHGPARAGDIQRSLGDPGRARTLLGVAADTDIATGLARLMDSLVVA